MNDDLIELERELGSLRLQPASLRVEERIAAGLARSLPSARRRSATAWTSWKWVNWGVAAALTGLMAIATLTRPARPPAAGPAGAPTNYTPVAAERTLYATDDEGMVTLADGSAGRRVRSRYVDTITWYDPASNASLRWSVPSEEIRVVPIRVN